MTTGDYLVFFAREGLKQLREKTDEIHCVITIVADILFPSKSKFLHKTTSRDSVPASGANSPFRGQG